MNALDGLLLISAAILLVPAATFAAECLLALRHAPCLLPLDVARPRIGVLVPAHDEASVLEPTLRLVVPELAPGDRLLVVAHNCGDATAELARAAGAEVLNLTGPEGKGHALAAGVARLAEDPPEVVLVLDADSALTPGSLELLARHASASGRPVQADYSLTPVRFTPRARLAAFFFSVRNSVRPAGLRALGLPAQLTGTGMAFPWQVLAESSLGGGCLVEDLLLGIDLALAGAPPCACPDARVSSALPRTREAAQAQRRRWQHGHLALLVRRAPPLLCAGIRRRDPGLIALALDLAVPPLTALACVLALLLAVSVALAMLALASWLPAAGAALSLGLVFLGVFAAQRADPQLLPLAVLVRALPACVLERLALYRDLVLRGTERHWVRTPRDDPRHR